MDLTERHPFLRGLSKHRGAPPTVLVIFGASGDLTARKLLPALYNLAVDHLLPADFFFVGYGRREVDEEEFRRRAAGAVREYSRRSLQEEVWAPLRNRTFYQTGSYEEEADFRALAERLAAIEHEVGRELQYLFYISTPPGVFAPILDNLGRSGLASHHEGSREASKVVIEKPFGHDRSSAEELNGVIARNFRESQVFRIDHYLGKETVQDLLVQRFANTIFEPLWNRQYVDSVQITVAEDIGVGARAGYYDQSGALRDMIQNHAMQLVSLTAMEPPVSLDPEAIRDEKVKVLKAIGVPVAEPEEGDVVRAQYEAGLIEGEKVPGYLEEFGVAEDSATETFAALRLWINNWRWKGVPFYVRSGKRMARRTSEIAVQFKRPPGILFSGDRQFDLAANTMVIQVQPDEGQTLLLNSKIPGLETRTQPVKMHFRYAATYGSNTPEAYERLVMDAMVGDSTLFIRGDETEASWRLITPVLEAWQAFGRAGLASYPAGSWGPLAADRLLWEHRHEWRRPGA